MPDEVTAVGEDSSTAAGIPASVLRLWVLPLDGWLTSSRMADGFHELVDVVAELGHSLDLHPMI
jgi:hypothetical protein